MTARAFPVPLGVHEADVIREQRAAELRIVNEQDQHFATGFPRSEAFTDREYIQAYRSECYHLALVWAFGFFRDVDPETDFAAARALAIMAIREEFKRPLHEAERSLAWSVARDAMVAKATLARQESAR